MDTVTTPNRRFFWWTIMVGGVAVSIHGGVLLWLAWSFVFAPPVSPPLMLVSVVVAPPSAHGVAVPSPAPPDSTRTRAAPLPSPQIRKTLPAAAKTPMKRTTAPAGAPAAQQGPVNPPKFGVLPNAQGTGPALPAGNTTDPTAPMGGETDPRRPPTGPQAQPGGAGGGGTASQGLGTGDGRYHTEDTVKRIPQHDKETCTAAMQKSWNALPEHQRQDDTVLLRVKLNEQGKPDKVEIIRKASKEMDGIAIGFIRFAPACKFTPALDTLGNPVPFVIETYSIRFKINDRD